MTQVEHFQFEADVMSLTIDRYARIQDLTLKDPLRDLLPEGVDAPLVQLKIQGELRKPTGMSARGEGIYAVHFAHKGAEVGLKIEPAGSHIRFEVTDISRDVEIELLKWGPYPTTISESIGEVIGVVRGAGAAFGIQALNPKTLGGDANRDDDVLPAYDIFATDDLSDTDETIKDLYRGDAALARHYGSSVQAFVRDRSQARVIENWAHNKFAAPAYEDGGVVGSAIALFACEEDKALETIGKIELAEGLPHPMLGGEWAKTSPLASMSYMILGFGEQDVDEALALTKKAGLMGLYQGGPFSNWGHFELNKDLFPQGSQSLKRCVEAASEQGVVLGVHMLSNFITTNDPYVTPIPDPRLASVGSSSLIRKIDEDDTTIEVADPSWFDQMKNNTLKSVRIGSEIFTYERVEGNKLIGCGRGAFGTAAAFHPAGSEAFKLMDHGYRTFLTDMDLGEEVARNIADLFNETGLRQISFDGLEGNWASGMGQYGRTIFTEAFFNHLKPELQGRVINDASNPGHYFWHRYTRMNWGEPWYAGFRESQTRYRLMNQRMFERNLMPNMLGWFSMNSQTSVEDAQWLLARAAGFDAGFAFNVGYDSVDKNGSSDQIFELITQWEKARLSGAFPKELKPDLQDIAKEFHLRTVGENEWDLHPVSITRIRAARESNSVQVEIPAGAQALEIIVQKEGDDQGGLEGTIQFDDGRKAVISQPRGTVWRFNAGTSMVTTLEHNLVSVKADEGELLGSGQSKTTCTLTSTGPSLMAEVRLIGRPIRIKSTREIPSPF